MFAAILTPLGIRLMLPFVADELPKFAEPVVSLLVWYTDLLAVPFAAFELPGFLRSAVFGFGDLEPRILVALIGWGIVQTVVLTVLGLFGHRSDRSGRRRGMDDEA